MSPTNQVVLPKNVQSSITVTVTSTVPIILSDEELEEGRKYSFPPNAMSNT